MAPARSFVALPALVFLACTAAPPDAPERPLVERVEPETIRVTPRGPAAGQSGLNVRYELRRGAPGGPKARVADVVVGVQYLDGDTDGSTVAYVVTAIGDGGEASSPEAIALGVPARPAGLRVEGVADGIVTLAWDAAEDVTAWLVLRAERAGDLAQGRGDVVATVERPTSSLHLVEPAYLAIVATNAVGRSAPSAEIFFDPAAPDAGTPDAGAPDAGSSDAGPIDPGPPDAGSFDGGSPDAGAPATPVTIGTGFTDLIDIAIEPVSSAMYVLGGGKVHRCTTSSCDAAASPVVSNVFATSIVAVGQILYLTTDYVAIKACDAADCVPGVVLLLGQGSYPGQLTVANGRLYFVTESGSSRFVRTCPLPACETESVVYTHAALNGVAISGLAIDGEHLYLSSYTGGLRRVTLEDEASASGEPSVIRSTPYATGGLAIDGRKLRWVEQQQGRVMECDLPNCLTARIVAQDLLVPTALASDATHLFGVERGTPTAPGSARVWRLAK